MLRILWLFFSLCYIQHNCIPTSHALSFLYVFLFLFLSLSYLSSFYPTHSSPCYMQSASCQRKLWRGRGRGSFCFFCFSLHFISSLCCCCCCPVLFPLSLSPHSFFFLVWARFCFCFSFCLGLFCQPFRTFLLPLLLSLSLCAYVCLQGGDVEGEVGITF